MSAVWLNAEGDIVWLWHSLSIPTAAVSKAQEENVPLHRQDVADSIACGL